MTYEIDWEPGAVDLAARYLADDPDGLAAVLAAVDSLGANPRPDDAFPLGATGILRLRVGDYRVVYEVDEGVRTVSIMHVGRRT